SKQYIGDEVLIFRDSGHQMTPDQLWADSHAFKKSDSAVPNLGVSESASWVKFMVYNDSDNTQLVLTITNPTIDEVTLFTMHNGERDSSSVSESDRYDNRDYYHQFFAFNLNVNKGDSIACLLRLKS